MFKYEKSVVVANGSGICRAGFFGEDEPQAVFPSIAVGEKYP
jgi:actin-related protein